MIKRKANTEWRGSGKKGEGNVSVDSKIFEKAPFAFGTRFKDDDGTNPEELIAAAHSGCFTMALSFKLSEAGFEPKELKTECTVSFEDGAITESHLELEAVVPGISEERFKECFEDAAKNCPISKLLNTEITKSYEFRN